MTEEEIDEAEFDELVEEFNNQERLNSCEGTRGINNLEELIVAIDPNYKYDGYDTSTLHIFLKDNSGAIEAIHQWILEQGSRGRNNEWKENLKECICVDEETECRGCSEIEVCDEDTGLCGACERKLNHCEEEYIKEFEGVGS